MTAPLLKALIVDDEGPARLRLRQLLADAPDYAVAGEAANGLQAVELIRELKPDLVLLDVQMPKLDGFGVCTEVGVDQMPTVVFVTAYDRFALQAFEVHAMDYLLKPVDRDRFLRTLRRVREQRAGAAREPGDTRLTALLAELRDGRKPATRLALKVDGKVLFVRPADIEWMESEGNYVKVHAAGQIHLVRETLSALEADLPSDQFLRISRSVMVSLDVVREIQPMFYGDCAVILRDGTKLTLSRTYRDRLERWVTRR